MRKNFIICSILMASMIIIPLTAMEKQSVPKTENASKTELQDGYISVMRSENGYVENLEEREYIIGAVAAEMNIGSHDEALKAQAVVCYTYALYCKEKGGTQELNGADISDDTSSYQGYINEKERKEKWGDEYEKNEKKLEKIIDSVIGKYISYNGEPILAAFHDLCSGETESAKTVWGKDIPYLQSVQSRGDTLSTNYTTEVALSQAEFEMFAEKIDGVNLSKNVEEWLGETNASDSGYVNTIEIGSKEISGNDFRKAFGLKSCNFTVDYSSDKFKIKTLGNGHMVGMSQYGADYMARQGSDWQEIIKHYYTEIEIK